MSSSPPETVSPGSGSRDVFTVRSTFALPITQILGIGARGASQGLDRRPPSSPPDSSALFGLERGSDGQPLPSLASTPPRFLHQRIVRARSSMMGPAPPQRPRDHEARGRPAPQPFGRIQGRPEPSPTQSG